MAVPSLDEVYGTGYLLQGRLDEALDNFRNRLTPSSRLNAALCLIMQEKYEEALPELKRLVDDEPAYIRGYPVLANCYRHMRRFDNSLVVLLKARQVGASWPQVHFLLSAALMRVLDVEGAVKAMVEGLVAAATSDARDTDDYARCYHDPVCDSSHVFVSRKGAATLLDCLYAESVSARTLLFLHQAHDPAPSTSPRSVARLSAGVRKVVVVSEHFHYGAMTGFMLPFVRELSSHMDTVCYSLGSRSDAITEAFCGVTTLHAVGDGRESVERVRERVKAVEADVLICLDGFTGSCLALNLVSTRLAKVQVDYLGYAHPTGRASIDLKVVDQVTDPEKLETSEDVEMREPLLRLPRCFLSWEPVLPDGGLMASVVEHYRPAPDARHIIAPHNFKKLSPTTVRLFRGVLAAYEGATLYLKCTLHDVDDAMVDIVKSKFGDLRGRVEVIPYVDDVQEHYRELSFFDLCLDAFPYNGTTTTIECVFCGVPVVTLQGKFHRSRVSASLLTAVERASLVARSEVEYVSKAVEVLHKTGAELREMHSDLAAAYHASPLKKHHELTRAFVDAIPTVE